MALLAAEMGNFRSTLDMTLLCSRVHTVVDARSHASCPSLSHPNLNLANKLSVDLAPFVQQPPSLGISSYCPLQRANVRQ